MPKPYPREFREDVIRVARSREPDVMLKTIASDFGVLRVVPEQLAARRGCRGWDQARDDRRPENEELRKAKRRIRLLEQENEVLRRAAAYLSQANLPPR